MADVDEAVRSARVLVVGAGGIGCELLKTLALQGFRDIHVVDMDTIETSNLNRQFLFRRHHVGQPKAKVAAEAVSRIRRECKIQAYHANVRTPEFGATFIGTFNVVLNALDNLDARRHVNRACLAAGVPLVESGTAGYLGQVTVHMKPHFECFECTPKPTPKSYPICTIRNTPDKPIHCTVWAKELLFARLFGPPDAVTDLDEETTNEGGEGTSNKAENGTGEPPAGEKEDLSFFLQRPDEKSTDFAQRIFERVYGADIERLLTMEHLWKQRAAPKPLKVADNGTDQVDIRTALKDTQRVWSVAESAAVFLDSVSRFCDERDVGCCAFDKDDDLAVSFVCAAANLRGAAFSIPPQSWFDAKGMAGAIVHAIATTNAIAAGMVCLEAEKILRAQYDRCRCTYILRYPSNRKLLMPTQPCPPNPHCFVCAKQTVSIEVDVAKATLGVFIAKGLKQRLGFAAPTVCTNEGDLLFEDGDDLTAGEKERYAKALGKTLEALGVKNNSLLTVEDFSQNFECSLLVEHRDNFDPEKEPDGIIVKGSAAAAAPETPPAEATAADKDMGEVHVVATTTTTMKRKRPAEAEDELATEIDNADRQRQKRPVVDVQQVIID
eukprot:jgi/Chlat1/3681/Chrsp24S08831